MLGKWELDLIQDDNGNAIVVAGATVTVRRESTGALAQLYGSQDGDTQSPPDTKANPFTLGPSETTIKFWASVGDRYRIDITKGTLSRTLRYESVKTPPISDSAASSLAGELSPVVPTISALAALEPRTTSAQVLGRTTPGDGGGGLFRWDSSDLSTEVSADTQNEIYVPPNSDTTGASGAWVRIRARARQIAGTRHGDVESELYRLNAMGPRMELIAHRGFRGHAPQNTLLAMSMAVARGADSLECDVQPSSDGVLYLFHDTTVDALTNGTGTFTQLSSTTIDSLSFDETVGTPYEDVRIPKFSDFLTFAKAHGLYIYPEIKHYRTIADVDLMVDAVVNAGMEELCMFQSFRIADLRRVRSQNDVVSIGMLGQEDFSVAQPLIDELAILGRGAILWDYTKLLADPTIVEYAYSKGVGVGAWTVNTTYHARRLMEIGVYRIMSDISLKV